MGGRLGHFAEDLRMANKREKVLNIISLQRSAHKTRERDAISRPLMTKITYKD